MQNFGARGQRNSGQKVKVGKKEEIKVATCLPGRPSASATHQHSSCTSVGPNMTTSISSSYNNFVQIRIIFHFRKYE